MDRTLIPFDGQVTVLCNPPRVPRVVFTSPTLDTYGYTLANAFASVMIVTDSAPDLTFLQGRLVQICNSPPAIGLVVQPPVVDTGNVRYLPGTVYSFPLVTSGTGQDEGLPLAVAWQCVFAGSGVGRVLTLRFTGALVAGQGHKKWR